MSDPEEVLAPLNSVVDPEEALALSNAVAR